MQQTIDVSLFYIPFTRLKINLYPSLLIAKERNPLEFDDWTSRYTEQNYMIKSIIKYHPFRDTSWVLFFKHFLAQGLPYTPIIADKKGENSWLLVKQERNSKRYPFFDQLDLKIGRIVFIDTKIIKYFQFNYEIQNILDRRNIYRYDWYFYSAWYIRGEQLRRVQTTSIGRYWSAGLRIGL